MASTIRGSDNFDSAVEFGIGQTVQDMLASRANATDYTNDTGKPIMVMASGLASAAGGSLHGYLSSGTVLATRSISPSASVTVAIWMLVPPGITYRITAASCSLATWYEYRT